MYKIEKCVPIPPTIGPKNFKYAWPFASMEKGDSFVIEADTRKAKERLRSAALNAAKRIFKTQITTRVVPGGIRIWKVA